MLNRALAGLFCTLNLYAAFATAQIEFDLVAEVGMELRAFPEAPQFDGQFETFQPSWYGESALTFESADRRHQFKLTPFGRLDGQDSERTRADIREAYWRYNGQNWDILVGANRVFWGVTESRHLVNIINQIDAIENLDEEDFLGQPMLNLGLQRDFGRFDLIVMTGFRERTFPGLDGRLRSDSLIDIEGARIERSGDEWAADVAVRYSHFIGDIDIGLHAFHGTGREPFFEFVPEGSLLVPVYHTITQGGIDFQYTRGPTLWKLEALYRSGREDTFMAVVAGFEHTFFRAFGNADLGVLMEVLYDGRDPFLEPATGLENDVFLAGRVTLNDVEDTSLLAGAFVDYENGTTGIRAEYETRLSDAFRLEIEAQWFAKVDEEDSLTTFEEDSFITLRLTRFF